MKTCETCGRHLPDGSLAYEVRIQVQADFDGILPEADPAEDIPAVLAAAAQNADALLRQVIHSERHLLCPGCRDRYLANPLNRPLGPDSFDPR